MTVSDLQPLFRSSIYGPGVFHIYVRDNQGPVIVTLVVQVGPRGEDNLQFDRHVPIGGDVLEAVTALIQRANEKAPAMKERWMARQIDPAIGIKLDSNP